MNYADARIRTMLRELGKERRQEALRARRRAQLRYRAGQVLNAIGYLALAGGAAAVLLSL